MRNTKHVNFLLQTLSLLVILFALTSSANAQ